MSARNIDLVRKALRRFLKHTEQSSSRHATALGRAEDSAPHNVDRKMHTILARREDDGEVERLKERLKQLEELVSELRVAEEEREKKEKERFGSRSGAALQRTATWTISKVKEHATSEATARWILAYLLMNGPLAAVPPAVVAAAKALGVHINPQSTHCSVMNLVNELLKKLIDWTKEDIVKRKIKEQKILLSEPLKKVMDWTKKEIAERKINEQKILLSEPLKKVMDWTKKEIAERKINEQKSELLKKIIDWTKKESAEKKK